MKAHLSIIRTIDRAGRNTTAKTARGLAAWLRANPSRPLPLDATPSKYYFPWGYTSREKRWTEMERLTRRVRNDKVFAAELAKTLRPVRVRSIRAADEYIASYTKRRETQRVLGSKYKALKLPENCSILPCGEEEAKALGVQVCKRGKDWSVSGDTRTHHEHTPGETTWKNGRAVSYTRASNVTNIRALAVIVGPRKVVVSLHGQPDIRVELPEGMRWDIDGNGLRAIRGRDDYHPEGIDFLAADPVAGMLVKLEANAKKRREMEARIAAEKASAEGVFVCLADSIRAGNCRAGSLSFAERHKLDIRRHYPALELLAQANGDASRVKLAITAAKIRHAREMERGFALLEEHVA